jgi:hypothetical protein
VGGEDGRHAGQAPTGPPDPHLDRRPQRARWDALEDDPDEILREFVAYRDAGIQHLVAEPRQRDLDAWLRCGEAFAKIFERAFSA